MRRATHAAMVRETAATGTGLTLRGVGSTARGELGVRPPDNIRDIRLAFAKASDAVQNGRELPEVRVSPGRLLPAHADALGIDPAETTMHFNSPWQARKQGAAHWIKTTRKLSIRTKP